MAVFGSYKHCKKCDKETYHVYFTDRKITQCTVCLTQTKEE